MPAIRTYHPTYGSCPVCGAAGANRERTLRGGRDTCTAGHVYSSAHAVYPVNVTVVRA